jgi:hypothetical protein
MGMPLGTPLVWHRKAAMILGGSLPESPADAQLVMQALHELVDEWLYRSSAAGEEEAPRATNVLAFTSS